MNLTFREPIKGRFYIEVHRRNSTLMGCLKKHYRQQDWIWFPNENAAQIVILDKSKSEAIAQVKELLS